MGDRDIGSRGYECLREWKLEIIEPGNLHSRVSGTKLRVMDTQQAWYGPEAFECLKS